MAAVESMRQRFGAVARTLTTVGKPAVATILPIRCAVRRRDVFGAATAWIRPDAQC